MAIDRCSRWRVLVVEDEALLALDIADMLAVAGYDVEGPYGTLEQAMAVASRVSVDVALLDVNLARKQVWPVADVLLERSIPVVLMTGYASLSLPPRYAGLVRLDKPVEVAMLMAALTGALSPPPMSFHGRGSDAGGDRRSAAFKPD